MADFFYGDLYRLDYSERAENGNRSINLDLEYDSLGNITSRSDVAGGTFWTYPRAKNIRSLRREIRQVNTSCSKNTLRRVTLPFSWNYENQLQEFCQGSECSDFRYTPDGERLSERTFFPRAYGPKIEAQGLRLPLDSRN